MILLFDDAETLTNNGSSCDFVAWLSFIVALGTFVFSIVWAFHLRRSERKHSFFDSLVQKNVIELFSREIPAELKKFEDCFGQPLELVEKGSFQDFITKAVNEIGCLKYINAEKYDVLKNLLFDMDECVQKTSRKTKEFADELFETATKLYCQLKYFY